MSGKIALTARRAKETGITGKLCLCVGRVAAVLKLVRSIPAPADGVSYHKSIGCPPFGAAMRRTFDP